MFNKRILSLVLCASLLSGSLPDTVSAAEGYDKNDTYVINDNETEISSELAFDAEANFELGTETGTNTETVMDSESNSVTETETDAVFESKDDAEAEGETHTETETDTATESEAHTETQGSMETEPETEAADKAEGTETDTAAETEAGTETETELETETKTSDESDIQAAMEAFNELAAKKPLMALLYRTDSYNVRKKPSNDSSSVATINSGHTLYIKSVEILDDGIWYAVELGLSGSIYNGYVESYYLAYSDEDWINWEKNYDTSVIKSYALTNGIDTSDIDAFPAAYQDKLKALKELHPNWTFVPMNTGLDFNTVVANEMGDKSLIQNTTSNAANGWVGKSYGSGWYYATKDAVAYHMNPLNFLTEGYIFQFEQLTFNSSYHSVSAIQSFLNGTFMKGVLPDDSQKRSYAQAFYEIGKGRNLSPIHLASRVYQEQGNGKSALISGTYSGYEGYYNYFNVKASGTTEKEIIVNGLAYAKSQGWNTRYKSLSGGAATIGNSYILKGQDTSYLEKFNVDGSYYPLYTHQYMQNIQAPSSESLSSKKMYANAGSLNSAFVFKIPVFKNMSQENHLEKIVLDKSSLFLQTSGSVTGSASGLDSTDTLTLSYQPSNTTDEITVKWSSSNPEVAAVTAADSAATSAMITAMSEGTAVITASAENATTGEVKTASCEVTVTSPPTAIESCSVVFMDSDNITVLKSLTVPYKGTVSAEDFPIIDSTADKLFAGWFTGKNGKGFYFDSTTVLSSEETVLYPYFEQQGKGFYVLPVSDYTYTGSAIKPEVQVFDSLPNADGSYRLITLEKGKDYTVSYKNNKNVSSSGSAVPTVVIKGKGNYTGTEYAYFNILPKSLSEGETDITADNLTLAYSGKLQKPIPVVYRSGKKLSAKKDFTVTYPNTASGAYTKAGTYPIKIKGINGYTGTRTIYVKITSDTLMSKVKVEKIPNQIYDERFVSSGNGMTPDKITVTYGDRTLKEGTDYTVNYKNHLSVGTATAYITAKSGSGFSGTKAVTYKIVGSPISKATVTGIVSKTYTGMEEDVLQKNVSLSIDGTTLKENKDYTVSYSNTTKAGTAAITFKGINGYSGQLKKTYKITPFDITNGSNNPGSAITMAYATQDAPDTLITISALSQISSSYMKGSTCPNVQLYLNDVPLIKGKDYTIKYANNKQVTTSGLTQDKLPTITVTGKGSFKGSLTGTWNITDGAFDNENNKVTLSLKDVVYKNAPNKFKTTVQLTDANGAKLSAGKDYDTNVTFSYAENTTVSTIDAVRISRKAGDLIDTNDIPDAGTIIRVTVKGKGAYEGNGNAYLSNTYRIVSADISKAKVSVKAKTYQNGDAVTLTADDIEIILNGETLEFGKTYTIDHTTYLNNQKKGKATVVLRGLGGNYGGEKKITFTIGSKLLVWWKNLL